MKPVTKSNRVIRVPAVVHLQAKIAAASEDRPLSDLAAEILTEALERRRKALDENPTLAASLASIPPYQTR